MSNPLGPPNLDGVNILIGWAIAAEVEKMRQWRLEKEIQDKNYWRPKIYEKISREYSNLDDKDSIPKIYINVCIYYILECVFRRKILLLRNRSLVKIYVNACIYIYFKRAIERVFESEYEKIKRQRLENVPLMRVGCGERIETPDGEKTGIVKKLSFVEQ